ncbi:MAG: hypothetical protein DMF64_10890 [Acidobacteria bacterium]|nr:MAG: hypothetical protein DMF64_10890 [Acidobacteriota bacterium]
MRKGRVVRLIAIVATLFVFVIADRTFCQVRSGSNYQLTIYADEGSDKYEPFGHVFIGLTNGQTTLYKGWNTSNHVEDESNRIANCDWNVRKTYDITPSGYEKALQVINGWNTNKLRFYNVVRPGYHCGDFAEAVAKAAGVQINLSWQMTGRNRPELFGEYLRDHGADISAETYYVNDFVETRIFIRRGDKVKIRASGEVSFGPIAGSAGPEGISARENSFLQNYNHMREFPHGCLIGRVHEQGDDTGWDKIGKYIEFTSEAAGVLELDVNDADPKNNEGKFEVEVNICGAHQ